MADCLTPQQRHHIMSSIPATSTKPEMKLRKELWRRGFRYKLNVKKLPGSPDIVLPKYRTVLFVHGCFWHGHEGCKKYVVPKSNTQFWVDKVSRNRERDEKMWRQLEALDWAVVIVWECELDKKNFDSTIIRVEQAIRENGEAYQRHKKERALYRQQLILERKAHRDFLLDGFTIRISEI